MHSGSSCYRQLRDALLAYISPLTVDMVLNRTLASIGSTAEGLGCDQLDLVVEAAMLSLRMFVPEDRLPDLMIELAELVDDAVERSQGAHTAL